MPFYDFNGVARTYLDKNNDPNIAELGSGPYICTLKARHYIFDILENYDLNCSEGS